VRPNLYGIEKVDIDRVSLAWMERFEWYIPIIGEHIE
jgi:hypothetical protein